MSRARRVAGTAFWALTSALGLVRADQGQADAGNDAASQRAAIASARATIAQRYAEQEQDCSRRFVVTSCLNDARQQRRTALVPLRQEELRIDMAERRQRGADRLEEIEAKHRADVAKGAASETAPATAPQAASSATDTSRAAWMTPPRSRTVDAAERQRREAESVARFEAQQADAARHRAEVERRNAVQAAQGRVARPLPVPRSASSAL